MWQPRLGANTDDGPKALAIKGLNSRNASVVTLETDCRKHAVHNGEEFSIDAVEAMLQSFVPPVRRNEACRPQQRAPG